MHYVMAAVLNDVWYVCTTSSHIFLLIEWENWTLYDGDTVIHKKTIRKQTTCKTPPHFCACLKPRSRFPTSYAMVLFMFNDLRREVIVRLVDISGIVVNQCLSYHGKIRLISSHRSNNPITNSWKKDECSPPTKSIYICVFEYKPFCFGDIECIFMHSRVTNFYMMFA